MDGGFSCSLMKCYNDIDNGNMHVVRYEAVDSGVVINSVLNTVVVGGSVLETSDDVL